MRILLLALMMIPTALVADEKDEQDAEVQAQQLAVERSARAFRIQVFESFRLRRPQYDLFRKQGDAVLRAWESAPADFNHDEIAAWYARGSERAVAGLNPPQIPSHVQVALTKLDAKTPSPKVELPRRSVAAPEIHRGAPVTKAPKLTPSIVDFPNPPSATPAKRQPQLNPTLPQLSQPATAVPPAPISNQDDKANTAPEPQKTSDDSTEAEPQPPAKKPAIVGSVGRALLRGVTGQ